MEILFNTIYEKSKKYFNLKKNFYKNLYDPWRKNNKLFFWYSIYDNVRTKDNQIYLKDVCTSYLYKSDNKNIYWHHHIIWGSIYHFNKMALSHHLYIDWTFLTTKEFYQMIIIMYYHDTIEKKNLGGYILINSKEKNSYIMILNVFKRLLTKENSRTIKLFTISRDFEYNLFESVKEVFKEVRHVGCLFHYVKQMRLNMCKIGLYNHDYKEYSDDLLKDLTKIPFFNNHNHEVIKTIYDKYKNLKKKDTIFINLLDKLVKYYNKVWGKYLSDGTLNYAYLNKIQRSNSYLENYNKKIKQ